MANSNEKAAEILDVLENYMDMALEHFDKKENPHPYYTVKIMRAAVSAYKAKAQKIGLGGIDLTIIMLIDTLFNNPQFADAMQAAITRTYKQEADKIIKAARKEKQNAKHRR